MDKQEWERWLEAKRAEVVWTAAYILVLVAVVVFGVWYFG